MKSSGSGSKKGSALIQKMLHYEENLNSERKVLTWNLFFLSIYHSTNNVITAIPIYMYIFYSVLFDFVLKYDIDFAITKLQTICYHTE